LAQIYQQLEAQIDIDPTLGVRHFKSGWLWGLV